MEKQEQQKFPANQQRIAGKIVDSKLNETKDKLNLTIVTPSENNSGKFLKVYISGSERVENFLKHQEEARRGLPEEKSVHLAITGTANFARNGQHQNNTLIVRDKLEKNSENFVMPKNAAELVEFNTKYHSRAAENNQIRIIGRLGSEPEFKTTTNDKGTSTFATFPFYHNYTTGSGDNEQNHSIQANVIVPTAQLDKFKEVGYEKGHIIKLEGQIQPKVYEPKDGGEKVYTFNIIARDIIPDLNKSIEESKAADKSQGKEAASEKLNNKKKSIEQSKATEKSLGKEAITDKVGSKKRNQSR